MVKKKILFTTLISFIFLLFYLEIFRSIMPGQGRLIEEGYHARTGGGRPRSIIDIIGTLAARWTEHSRALLVHIEERMWPGLITGQEPIVPSRLADPTWLSAIDNNKKMWKIKWGIYWVYKSLMLKFWAIWIQHNTITSNIFTKKLLERPLKNRLYQFCLSLSIWR